MAEVAVLNVKIVGARGSADDLNKLTIQIEKSAASAKKLKSSFGGMGRIFAAIGIGQLAKQIFSVNNEFQKLEAGLHTVTGSAVAGKAAFQTIKRMAIETPFSVRQLTEAFIQLRARGLSASEDVLKAYGDMASAFPGMNVLDVVHAVGSATTGMSVPLKKFGVIMKQQGDQVRLSFKGQTVTVKRSAKEIEEALVKIAKQNFSGSMKRQMNTIGGALSNLEDSMEQFADNIGKAGLNDAITAVFKSLTDIFTNSPQIAEAIGLTLTVAVQTLNGAVKILAATLSGAIDLMKQIPDFTYDGKSSRETILGPLKDKAKAVTGAVYSDPQKSKEYADSMISGFSALGKALYTGKLPKGFKPVGGTSDEVFGSGSKKVDALKEALSDLDIQARKATDTFSLFLRGSDEQSQALQIETRLLEFYYKMIDSGKEIKDADLVRAEEAIRTAVETETAIKNLTKAEEIRKTKLKETQSLDDQIASQAAILAAYEKSIKAGELEAEIQEHIIELKGEGGAYTDEELKKLTEQITSLEKIKDKIEGIKTKEKTDLKAEKAEEKAAAKLEKENPINQFVDQYKDAAEQIDQIFANVLDSTAEHLTEFIMTGKTDWKGFFDDIAKMALKSGLQTLFANILSLGGAGTGGAGLTSGITSVAGLHDGGIVGQNASFVRSVPSGLFSGASRYHSGGVAGLRPNEIPAILEKGEEVVPKGQRRGSVTINVHGVTDADSFRRNERQIKDRLRRH